MQYHGKCLCYGKLKKKPKMQITLSQSGPTHGVGMWSISYDITFLQMLFPERKGNRSKYEVSSVIYIFVHPILKDSPLFFTEGKLSNVGSLFWEFTHFPIPSVLLQGRWGSW